MLLLFLLCKQIYKHIYRILLRLRIFRYLTKNNNFDEYIFKKKQKQTHTSNKKTLINYLKYILFIFFKLKFYIITTTTTKI